MGWGVLCSRQLKHYPKPKACITGEEGEKKDWTEAERGKGLVALRGPL